MLRGRLLRVISLKKRKTEMAARTNVAAASSAMPPLSRLDANVFACLDESDSDEDHSHPGTYERRSGRSAAFWEQGAEPEPEPERDSSGEPQDEEEDLDPEDGASGNASASGVGQHDPCSWTRVHGDTRRVVFKPLGCFFVVEPGGEPFPWTSHPTGATALRGGTGPPLWPLIHHEEQEQEQEQEEEQEEPDAVASRQCGDEDEDDEEESEDDVEDTDTDIRSVATQSSASGEIAATRGKIWTRLYLVCVRCLSTGHTAWHCPLARCTHCLAYGHEQEVCAMRCRVHTPPLPPRSITRASWRCPGPPLAALQHGRDPWRSLRRRCARVNAEWSSQSVVRNPGSHDFTYSSSRACAGRTDFLDGGEPSASPLSSTPGYRLYPHSWWSARRSAAPATTTTQAAQSKLWSPTSSRSSSTTATESVSTDNTLDLPHQ